MAETKTVEADKKEDAGSATNAATPEGQDLSAPQPAREMKSSVVEPAPAEMDSSLLHQRNVIEREIQLKGRADPDNFKIEATGKTITETRREMANEQIQEGQTALEANAVRVREQSIAGDPLYQEGAVRLDEIGVATVVEKAVTAEASTPSPSDSPNSSDPKAPAVTQPSAVTPITAGGSQTPTPVETKRRTEAAPAPTTLPPTPSMPPEGSAGDKTDK